MSTRAFTRCLAVAILALLLVAQAAQAFYDPSLGRWINRDPLSDQGASLLRDAETDEADDTASNPYSMVRNEPTRAVDSWGLKPKRTLEELKQFIELSQRLRDAIRAAQSGKGCACLESVTAHYCNCFTKHGHGGNLQTYVDCVCAATPSADCTIRMLEVLRPIWATISAWDTSTKANTPKEPVK